MLRILALITLAAVLAACSSSSSKEEVRREAYLDADYYTRLELPPNLTDPSFNKELLIPEPSAKSRQWFEEQTAELGKEAEGDAEDDVPSIPAAATKPARVLAGAALKADGDRRWLQLEQTVDEIWSVLEAFLVNEGLPVTRREPLIGLMETDWVSKYQVPADAGFFRRVFGSLEPDRLDRFTLQIEQGEAGGPSRVYVTHAGMEKFVEGDDINWKSRERETALEAEILQRLALYVGAAQSGRSLDGYRPFAERVRDSAFHASSIEVVGGRAHVRGRVEQALRALNIDSIESRDDALLITLDEDARVADEEAEEDEYAKASFIMQWLKSLKEGEDNRIVLQLTEVEQYTRVDFETPSGESDESVVTEQLSDRLRELLI